ncbi:hypothetical protein [Streptomyces sp. NPDC058644]|uniref:hypothetical protein n=1 Tax=unclassified Streptomyces TaxID=2593676 RepID=UPI00366479D6
MTGAPQADVGVLVPPSDAGGFEIAFTRTTTEPVKISTPIQEGRRSRRLPGCRRRRRPGAATVIR